MREDRPVLREIAWQEVFPGLLLLSAWKVSISVRAVLLGAIGAIATWLGWLVLDRAFGIPTQISIAFTWFSPRSNRLPLGGPGDWWLASPILEAWSDLTRPFANAFSPDFGAYEFAYFATCGLWALAVWAFVGGAITRLAAVQLTRDEKASWGQVLSFTRSKWLSNCAAPLLPMFGVLLAAVPLALLGLLSRAGGFGFAVVGLLWPVALFAGFVMAVLLVGLFLNWPLMWPTTSTEGTDSFDALSRSYAYSFQRPLRYAAYMFIVAAVGVLGWLLVSLFAGGVLSLAQWAVEWGSGNRIETALDSRESLDGMMRFGADLIFWENRFVGLIVTGFVFSYFFVSATAVYLLMRFHIDATETDEVYLSDEEDPRDLPPLTTDAAGIVQVADGAAGTAGMGSPEG